METKNIEIDKIIPYTNNPRNNKKAIDKVASSIKEFGFKQPLVLDKENVVIVGHTRLEAAKKLGIKEVPCIIANDLTQAQIKAYRIADNKVGEMAEWDLEKLEIEFEALKEMDFDLELTGFNLDDIEIGEEKEVIEDDFNAEEELESIEEPISKRGDIWLLGKHRLMCGDSTSEDDVKILMDGKKADMVFTDPPYGVSAKGGRAETFDKLKMTKIENDDLRGDGLTTFLSDFISVLQVKKGGSIYICYPWRTQEEFTKAIKENGYDIRQCIIWDKKVFGLNGGKGYRPQYEMIYFCCKDDFTWYGDKAQSNIWYINREIKREEQGNHPTPKPLELIAKAINNSSKKEDLVVDVFGGSGSTLISSEQTDRICYMMELDEKYSDVIVKRYINLKDSDEDVFLLRKGKKIPYSELLE